MDSYQAIKVKDPFAVPPIPKSFYHPSPLREVDGNQAIRSPNKRDGNANKRSIVEERFLSRNTTYKTSALPDIQALSDKACNLKVDDLHVISASDQFNESWPDSERPSTSFLSSESHVTSVSNANDEGDKVLSWNVMREQDGHKPDESTFEHTGESSGSVLKKYIDRFRNCAPRPREERMKEKMKTGKEFWWLHSSSANVGYPEVWKNESAAKTREPQLTKEALLAMDQETLELQSKADKLLSKSELSFASSGPIVSTVGLGSTSASESIEQELPVSFRPVTHTHTKGILENHWRSPASRQTESADQPAIPKSHSGDILSRWRLRRKMEEASGSAPSIAKCQKNPKTKMDVRLEEFKQKLLSQRALVTPEDIQYERQRMKIMTDEEIVEETVPRERGDKQQPLTGQPDPILERMHQITGTEPGHLSAFPRRICQDPVPEPQNFPNRIGDITRNVLADNSNDNNVGQFINVTSAGDNSQPLFHKDRNTTAASNNTGFVINDVNVDDFHSEVICDAKEKMHILSQNSSVSSLSPDEVDLTQGKKLLKNSRPYGHNSEQVSCTRGATQGQRDRKNLSSFEKNEVCDEEEDVVSVRKGARSDATVLHQFLEAEKPSDQSEQSCSEHGVDGQKKSGVKKPSSRKGPKDVTGEDMETSDVNNQKNSIKEKNRSRRKKPGLKNKARSDDNSSLVEIEPDKSNKDEISSEKFVNKELCDVQSDGQERQNLSGITSLQPENQGPPRIDRVPRSGRHSTSSKPLPSLSPKPDRPQVRNAIGQTVVDVLFDQSSVMSSVDSWASMFPQSPAVSHTLQETCAMTPSPVKMEQYSLPLMQSTPVNKEISSTDNGATDFDSDTEFLDDPLMQLLRQQRQDYILKLQSIESKLQDLECS